MAAGAVCSVTAHISTRTAVSLFPGRPSTPPSAIQLAANIHFHNLIGRQPSPLQSYPRRQARRADWAIFLLPSTWSLPRLPPLGPQHEGGPPTAHRPAHMDQGQTRRSAFSGPKGTRSGPKGPQSEPKGIPDKQSPSFQVRRGPEEGPQGGPEGIYRSSLYAKLASEPRRQSEEYQRRLQGVLYIV
eukprot:9095996-Pyramimonas_sp.AAC.1